MPETLPHNRYDTARAKRVDGDGGFKAAIYGGALDARHACVVGWNQAGIFNLPPPLNYIILNSAVGVDANTCVETGVKAAQGISAE